MTKNESRELKEMQQEEKEGWREEGQQQQQR